MTRFLYTLFAIVSLLITSLVYSQSNSDSLLFVRINSVYKSNLIDFGSTELLMLKFKTIPENFAIDHFFSNLSKGVYRSANSINDNPIVDSLNKMFLVYKVEFDKSQSGQLADSLLTKSLYYRGYLIALQKDYGSVSHYILQIWTQKFDFVEYKVTNLDCNYKHQL